MSASYYDSLRHVHAMDTIFGCAGFSFGYCDGHMVDWYNSTLYIGYWLVMGILITL